MQLVKIGNKGQVSIPRAVLDRLGIGDETRLRVDVTEDGGILLRRARAYALEIYSERRIREFEKLDRLTAAERRKLKALKK